MSSRLTFDWRQNRFFLLREYHQYGGHGFPAFQKRVFALDGVSAALLSSITLTHVMYASGTPTVGTPAFLPETGGFIAPSLETHVFAAVIPAAMSSTGVTTFSALQSGGTYERPSVAYDPESRLALLVARGTSGSRFLGARLLDETGNVASGELALSSTITATSNPHVIATRDGQFVVSYTGDAGAILERFAVAKASTPGRQWSAISSTIDTPAHGATVGASVSITGWTIDFGAATGTGIDAVHVWAFPSSGAAPIFVGADTTFSARPDIANVFGARFSTAGFRVSTTSLPIGTYTLAAFPHSSVSGTFGAPAVSTVTIATDPFTWIDTPTSGATLGSSFSVVGWAVDRGAASGAGIDAVHVYAFPMVNGALGSPRFLGIAAHGQSRPDVGAGFGDSRFNTAGYALGPITPGLAPGTYRIVVYARSTLTGTFSQASFADVTVP